jgi:hypothetical protein
MCRTYSRLYLRAHKGRRVLFRAEQAEVVGLRLGQERRTRVRHKRPQRRRVFWPRTPSMDLRSLPRPRLPARQNGRR